MYCILNKNKRAVEYLRCYDGLPDCLRYWHDIAEEKHKFMGMLYLYT